MIRVVSHDVYLASSSVQASVRTFELMLPHSRPVLTRRENMIFHQFTLSMLSTWPDSNRNPVIRRVK